MNIICPLCSEDTDTSEDDLRAMFGEPFSHSKKIRFVCSACDELVEYEIKEQEKGIYSC